jgi:adenylate cyclase
MAWRFGRKATRGLDALHDGFGRVAEGKYDEPVPVSSKDEVGDMLRGFNAMLETARERQFLENAFGRYVSPVVLAELRAKGESSLYNGERRDATVLFSDICGFTAMSASLPPERVIAVLNAYMSRMIDTIARFDGYINKFVGDAIMVVWNAPLDQPDHAKQALGCAKAMQEELAAANAEGLFGDTPDLEMGIGINTGPLVAGNLGNERQVEFTVLGDTVNVASRACGHATAGSIVMTSAVVEAAEVDAVSLGEVEVKGKGKMELFALRPDSLANEERDSFAPPESR